MKKKLDIRVYIIICLSIILTVMLFFYFKDDSSSNFDFSRFNNNKTSQTDSSTVTINASSQVSSSLTENLRLHATYYFKKLLVSKNQFVKAGTKIVEYTNGKYLKAPYDLVIVDYNIPSSKKICTTDHYIQVSSFNVLSVSFRVGEEKISSVNLGQTATVKIPALNNREFTAYVTDISNTAENGRFTVKVEFDNDGDVRIGMSANVSI